MRTDRAVRTVKALPKSRNFTAPAVTYSCGICYTFKTTALGEAWAHTLKHGPWTRYDDGLPVQRGLLYNRGEQPLTVTKVQG